MTLSPQLRAILVCPTCKGALTDAVAGLGLDCAACAMRFPIRDGIPVMLVDEALPLGSPSAE